jgi:NADPH oxidase
MRESWFRREFLNRRRLLFNILFYGSHLALFAYGWYSQVRLRRQEPPGRSFLVPLKQINNRLAGLNSLKFSVWTSRGAGLVLAYDGGLIILPMLRNCLRVLRPILNCVISVDESIWFHKQVAYSMAFWAAVHTTAHYINFINVERTRRYY